MSYNRRSPIRLTPYILLVALTSGCSAFADKAKLSAYEKQTGGQKLTAYDLNRKLLSSSDNYQESISETIDEILSENVSAEQRLGYQTVKVFYTNSAIDIATESDAVKQLMDMMVMVRLQRIVWNNGGHGFSKPEHAKRMASQLKKLEEDLEFIASRVFAYDTINTIHLLTEKWKRENPDREYIAFVRFQDFANSEEKATLEETIKSGGFLSTISDANQQIEETRFAFERALFLANHMPIMLGWQEELYLYKILSTGEIKDLINRGERLTFSMERISLIAEKLPADIRAILEANQKPIENIAKNIATASENFATISEELSPLFLEKEGKENNESDLKQMGLILTDVLATSKELVKITESLRNFGYSNEVANHLSELVGGQLTLVDKLFQDRVVDADERLERHRERIFYMLLMLSVVFPMIFFVLYVAAKRHVINYSRKN